MNWETIAQGSASYIVDWAVWGPGILNGNNDNGGTNETLKDNANMMDRGRPKIDPSPSPSPSTSRPPITSKSPSSRQYDPPPKIETVKRKPVPPSASPLIGRVPPLSSGGVVVAVGEDNLGDYNAADRNPQSFLQDPPTFPPPNVASPPLQVRDLDQWVSTFLAD